MTVVGSVGGAGLRVLRAGAVGAIGTASAVQALTNPMVTSVERTTGRLLAVVGNDHEPPRVPPSVAWHTGRRVHLDLEPLLPFAHWSEYAEAVEEAVRKLPGVTSAHVERALGRLVVEHREQADAERIWGAVCAVLEPLKSEPGGEPPSRTAPFADPGDPLALLLPVTAAAMDVVAIGAAVTGWVGRLPAVPRTARAAAAVLNHQPRVVSLLESHLGRVGTDILLSASMAVTHGLSQSVGGPALDLAQRGLQIAEAAAQRRTWRQREPDLASSDRPQAAVVPVISSAGAEQPRHGWAVTAAGEVSHVVVDGAIDVAVDSAKGAAGGAIEDYADQAANGSLLAAAGALLAGGGSEQVADAVLAGVPKAAHLGREAFAAVLGRGLADAGQLVLDPGALRRLDRVRVVVVDGAALRGDARAVLRAHPLAPGWDDDRVYEVADALLHGERAPEPDPDEPPAARARLRWIRQHASATPAEGREHADLMVDGERVGSVEVGWEVDPFAAPLLQTAHHADVRVVLRHVAGTDDLAGSVAEVRPAGTPLLELVRELRADRGPVMLITGLHPDFASTDTLAALAIADVAVALDDPKAATPWTADIITGPDLAAAVRLLAALPAARRATESAVRFAKAGSTLAGLLLVTGESGTASRISLRRWVSPVHAAAGTALVAGTLAARGVLRMPEPTPQPLTAWHALDPEIVYSRLAGNGAALVTAPSLSPWRRRIAEITDTPVLAPLRGTAKAAARLGAATRTELSDPLTPVLAVGAAASAILGSNVDAVLVAGVMTVNAIVGGIQRLRAERAAAALFAEQELLARRVVVPVVATTRRRLETARHGQRTVKVAAHSLRPGDVIDLAAPDVVPADARILTADDLEVDESFLTGESVPVAKQVESVSADESDRASMLFEGSTVVAGQARAIVVATGSATAASRAISAVADVGPAPGIQARLRELTSKVLPLTFAGGATVTGLALLHRASLRQAVADGVAIAVAAVPEGLPLVATISQLAAARRLSRHGVLVRTPRAIEALGRVHTVCFDKTGTLTENRLHVVAAVPGGTNPHRRLPGLKDKRAVKVLRVAAHACPQPQNGHGHAHATDEAVVNAAEELCGEQVAQWTASAEVPFESSRGYAAAVGSEPSSREPMLVLKGAPEEILPRCRFADPDTDRHRADELSETLAARGLRVLAVAQRKWKGELADSDADVIDSNATELELVGFVGLADVARASARPLVEALEQAGRQVVLITGDHPVTARAIAHQLGMPEDVRVVTGAEFGALDEDARAKLAVDVNVFARVSPEQKVQVVAALQHCHRVTAMVGDGANDAAAIRLADVGIGVSGRGSSAARGAADIVLTRDDLTILLDALVEGRNMWGSVRDALAILVGGNAGEVLFTLIGTALGSGRAPVGTRQVLLVNMLTDMFPALAVALTPRDPDPEESAELSGDELEAARREHRNTLLAQPAPSLDAPLTRQIINRGVVTAAGATAAWAIGNWTPGSQRRTQTMGLTALVSTQLAQTLLTRRHSPLVMATAVGSALALAAIVQTPVVSHFFGCTPLGPVAWTGVVAATGTATALSVFAPDLLVKMANTGTARATTQRHEAQTH
ncbi:cation-translocating P-type ATPase [Skermania sp. ID1734]|uniref:cation-translocating P-type ATPase n=1 Tax=Skermania sp. ID1734 TaxID=2597516 RepID=UPI001180D8B7|nr:cation-translocating P-type ATPase [Skermania sp. ID1734]